MNDKRIRGNHVARLDSMHVKANPQERHRGAVVGSVDLLEETQHAHKVHAFHDAAFRESVDVNVAKPGFLLARSERELAVRKTERGDYEAASELFEHAQQGYRRAFGIRGDASVTDEELVAHPEWGSFLNDQASCLLDRGHVDHALKLLKSAHAIQVRVLGDRHVEIAPVLCNVALAHFKRGEVDEALASLVQARKIFEDDDTASQASAAAAAQSGGFFRTPTPSSSRPSSRGSPEPATSDGGSLSSSQQTASAAAAALAAAEQQGETGPSRAMYGRALMLSGMCLEKRAEGVAAKKAKRAMLLDALDFLERGRAVFNDVLGMDAAAEVEVRQRLQSEENVKNGGQPTSPTSRNVKMLRSLNTRSLSKAPSLQDAANRHRNAELAAMVTASASVGRAAKPLERHSYAKDSFTQTYDGYRRDQGVNLVALGRLGNKVHRLGKLEKAERAVKASVAQAATVIKADKADKAAGAAAAAAAAATATQKGDKGGGKKLGLSSAAVAFGATRTSATDPAAARKGDGDDRLDNDGGSEGDDGAGVDEEIQSVNEEDPIGDKYDSIMAMMLFKAARNLLASAVGPFHTDTQRVLNSIAALHMDDRDFARAEETYREARGALLATRKDRLSLPVARATLGIGLAMLGQGGGDPQVKEALKMLKEAATIIEQLRNSIGAAKEGKNLEDHSHRQDHSAALKALAMAYDMLRDRRTAERYRAQAVKVEQNLRAKKLWMNFGQKNAQRSGARNVFGNIALHARQKDVWKNLDDQRFAAAQAALQHAVPDLGDSSEFGSDRGGGGSAGPSRGGSAGTASTSRPGTSNLSAVASRANTSASARSRQTATAESQQASLQQQISRSSSSIDGGGGDAGGNSLQEQHWLHAETDLPGGSIASSWAGLSADGREVDGGKEPPSRSEMLLRDVATASTDGHPGTAPMTSAAREEHDKWWQTQNLFARREKLVRHHSKMQRAAAANTSGKPGHPASGSGSRAAAFPPPPPSPSWAAAPARLPKRPLDSGLTFTPPIWPPSEYGGHVKFTTSAPRTFAAPDLGLVSVAEENLSQYDASDSWSGRADHSGGGGGGGGGTTPKWYEQTPIRRQRGEGARRRQEGGPSPRGNGEPVRPPSSYYGNRYSPALALSPTDQSRVQMITPSRPPGSPRAITSSGGGRRGKHSVRPPVLPKHSDQLSPGQEQLMINRGWQILDGFENFRAAATVSNSGIFTRSPVASFDFDVDDGGITAERPDPTEYFKLLNAAAEEIPVPVPPVQEGGPGEVEENIEPGREESEQVQEQAEAPTDATLATKRGDGTTLPAANPQVAAASTGRRSRGDTFASETDIDSPGMDPETPLTMRTGRSGGEQRRPWGANVSSTGRGIGGIYLGVDEAKLGNMQVGVASWIDHQGWDMLGEPDSPLTPGKLTGKLTMAPASGSNRVPSPSRLIHKLPGGQTSGRTSKQNNTKQMVP